MDTTEFRPQLHIAQQSRRDKLRIQQDFAFSHHNNLGPYDYDSTAADVRNYRGGNICYDPSEICSEMINFSAKRGGGEPTPPQFQPFPRENPPPSFHTSAAAAAAASSDPNFFDTWKSVGLQQQPTTSDWAANHSSVLDVMTGASPIYQNSLQELVSSSDGRTFGLEFASLRQKNDSGHVPWAVGGSELLLLPAYADQWSGGDGLDRGVTVAANDHSRALSLSLSSVPSPKVHETQTVERDFQTRDVHQDSRNWNPSHGRPLGPQSLTHRNPGPLGPFTGYSTILRSSKFLRPAQQLLEELCCISRPKNVGIHEASDEIMEDFRVSNEVVSDGDNGVRGGGGQSSFVFDSEKRQEAGGTSCSTDAYGSENFQRKAKLLFMQDEVWKKSKQYQQQMQMVVSSFETVAGLSAATPYVSLALKAISKHFRSLKSAITDQIKSIKNLMGEEFSSPPSGGGSNSSKGEANASMLKFFDQSFQKQKGSGSDNLGILEGQQHIWRPQRGLPERAVSILRAWLFDHFLHPYPTDTDKHMLASQTGLTRNQVSNWFINARVRVWKPMVEEIHMLETKGSSDNGKTATEECNVGDGFSNRARMCAKQVESSRDEDIAENRSSACAWNQEKRSRIEYDGSLMGVVGPAHHRSGAVEMMGGMGSVSLTLGLRQSAEQERNLRCYGGQILRDFVG